MKFALVCLASLVLSSCGTQSEDSKLSKQSNLTQYKNSAPLEENDRYPIKPHTDTTPGELCQHPSELRYPERIKYCNRNVDHHLKAEIFVHYDRELGYQTQKIDRMKFKIDHLIPLCMGGSNYEPNLWPQHETVYELTDPIEPFLCQRMAAGKIKQKDAVRIILEVKLDPNTTDARMQELERY